MNIYSQILAETDRRFPLSDCIQQLLESLALKTNATRAICGASQAKTMDGRRGSQENGSEVVIMNSKLGDEREWGIWFDGRFLWRGRGDANLWNLEVHR